MSEKPNDIFDLKALAHLHPAVREQMLEDVEEKRQEAFETLTALSILKTKLAILAIHEGATDGGAE